MDSVGDGGAAKSCAVEDQRPAAAGGPAAVPRANRRDEAPCGRRDRAPEARRLAPPAALARNGARASLVTSPAQTRSHSAVSTVASS